MNELKALNAIFQKHLKALDQLTLTQWQKLAAELGVTGPNMKGDAARKLALREYKAGK